MSDAKQTTTQRSKGAKKAATGAASESVETGAAKSETQGESEQSLANNNEALVVDIIKAEEEAYAEALQREEAAAKLKIESQSKLEGERQGNNLVNKGSKNDLQLDAQENEGSDAEPSLDILSVLGAFKVCSQSDEGFWRSGVKFHRLQATLVLVVDKEIETPPAVDAKDLPAEFVVFMEKSKAQRVHDEPRLIVKHVELEDVLDIKEMAEL